VSRPHVNRTILLIVLVCSGCSPTRGCATEVFTLAPDSPLPTGLTVPPGISRSDISVELQHWSGPFGSSVQFTMRNCRWEQIATVFVDTFPGVLQLDSPYPSYEVITSGSKTEVIQFGGTPPGVRINRDPALVGAIDKLLTGIAACAETWNHEWNYVTNKCEPISVRGQ
jgi:hypothetical protein